MPYFLTQTFKQGVRLKPIDLARPHGLSTQAVRNYEAEGILPAATRTPTGYRAYTPLHAYALNAFLALVPGHGHRSAAAIMVAVNRGAEADALRIIDESHVQLLDDRRTLQAVAAAARDLTAPPPTRDPRTASPSGPDPRTAPASGRDLTALPSGRAPSFVGPLSHRLGLRPATIRKWERAGLIQPRRDPATGYRLYSPADVRDAQLIHQLRRGGYRLAQIAPLIAQVRTAGGLEPLEPMLADWHARLNARSRAMLTGAAALDAYLAVLPEAFSQDFP